MKAIETMVVFVTGKAWHKWMNESVHIEFFSMFTIFTNEIQAILQRYLCKYVCSVTASRGA